LFSFELPPFSKLIYLKHAHVATISLLFATVSSILIGAPKYTLAICLRLLMFMSFGRVLNRAGLATFVRLLFLSEDYIDIYFLFTTASVFRNNFKNEVVIKT